MIVLVEVLLQGQTDNSQSNFRVLRRFFVLNMFRIYLCSFPVDLKKEGFKNRVKQYSCYEYKK